MESNGQHWDDDEILNFLIDELDTYQSSWDDALSKACEHFGIPNKELIVEVWETYMVGGK
jgi:hypothetical protein